MKKNFFKKNLWKRNEFIELPKFKSCEGTLNNLT